MSHSFKSCLPPYSSTYEKVTHLTKRILSNMLKRKTHRHYSPAEILMGFLTTPSAQKYSYLRNKRKLDVLFCLGRKTIPVGFSWETLYLFFVQRKYPSCLPFSFFQLDDFLELPS